MPEAWVVLLTREHEDNLPLIERLDELGIEAVEYPCIKTRIIPHDGGEICEGKRIDDFKVVAFTSKRGVTGMSGCYEGLAKSDQLIAVVGNKTAEAVEKNIGRRADIVAHPQTGEGLAKGIISKLEKPQPVLYVRGSKTSGTLKRMLEENGFEVCELIVYENISPEFEPLELDKPAIAVFASPSAAESFFQTNPGLEDSIYCVAIGPTTAGYLKERNIKKMEVALTPDSESLLASIKEVMKRGV